MPSGNNVTGRTRREWMKILGLGATAGVAGCLGNGDGNGSGNGNGNGNGGTTPTETDDPDQFDREVGGPFIAGSATDAETLFFPNIADNPSAQRVGLTMDGAYALDTDIEVYPLWLDIEDSGDATTWICTLRDNLYWSDPYGQMTSEDWVYMIENIHQGEDNWAGSTAWDDWQGVEVEATSELEFTITLPDVNPDFPAEPTMWGAFCAPKELFEPYVPDKDLEGMQQDDEFQTLAYTGNLGPYSYDAWDREASFRAVRNDDYYMREADDMPEEWSDAPYFESYSFRVIEEESTRMEAFRAGELTTVGIPTARADRFEGEEGIDVYEVPQPYLGILAYNQRANGWDQLRTREVRQALSMAVDKRVVTEQILRGRADFSFTFQPRWSPWYDESQTTRFGVDETYDHDEAMAMMEATLDSGYSYEDGDLIGPDGDQVELTLVYSEGTETTATTAEYMTQEFEAIGIKINLESVSFNRMIQQYIMNSPTDEYEDEELEWAGGAFNSGPREKTASEQQWDMMYGIRFNTYPRTPAATDAFWTTRSGTNYYGYEPDVDMAEKFTALRTTPDQDERRSIMAEILGILSEDQPVNFVSMQDDILGYQENVVGPIEEFGMGYDSATWYFDDA